MSHIVNVILGGQEYYVVLMEPDHPVLRWLGRADRDPGPSNFFFRNPPVELDMTHTTCPRCGKLWKISVSPLPKDDVKSEVCPECVADEARTVKRVNRR